MNKRTNNSKPNNIKSNKLFYGWVIVAVSGLLQFAGGTETFPVVGIFQQPMINEFGWSRANFSAPMTIGTILGGILGLGVGPWMDRYGGRGVMTLAGIMLGGVFVLMGFVQSLWQHYVLQALARTITAGAFFMVVSIVIPKWFVSKRGRATAYAGMGGRLGHMVLPLFAQKAISVANWRTAWISMGIMIWSLAVIPVLLFFRRTPEDLGLRPDGARDPDESNMPKASDTREEVSFAPKEVLRTRAFYCILLAQALLAFVISGTHFHWFSYLTGLGIPESEAVATIAISPLAGIPTTLLAGFLSERFHVRYILVVAYLGFAVTMLILVNTSTIQMAYVFGIALGATSGVTFTVSMIVWADYYGRGSIGAIRGITAPIQMTTNALGPLVAALTFDFTGSYGLIFWAFVIICFGSSGLWLLATRPEKVSNISY